MDCPTCGRVMEEVAYRPGHHALNRYQWGSVRAGDWWCEAENRYWFEREDGSLIPGKESTNNRRNPTRADG